MKIGIVDRYVARAFIGGYVILLLVGMGFYIMVDALVNLDEFTADSSRSGWQIAANMANYYGFNVPLYFSQLAGPMMCIAAAFTAAMMLKNNELTPLIASGVPLRRVCVPLMVCAAGLITVWAINRELLLPEIAHKVIRKRGDVEGQNAVNVNCVRTDDNAVLIAQRYYRSEGRMESLAIVEPGPDGGQPTLIEADAARYDEPRKTWVLERGRRIRMQQASGEGLGDLVDYEPVAEYNLKLTPEMLALRQASESADLLSARQMRRLAQTQHIANRSTIESNMHARLTQPLVQMLLVLLAVSFFLTREPTNVLAAGGWSLLLTGLFYGATFFVQSAFKNWNPAVIAWMPILAFGPIAVLRLANLRT